MDTTPWHRWATRLEAARTISLIGVAASLSAPLSIAINGGCIIATATFSLLLGLVRRKAGIPSPPIGRLIPLLSLLLFLAYVVGAQFPLYPWAVPHTEARLGLVAFPFMVLVAPLTARERDLALFSFTVSVSLLGIIAEVLALSQFLRLGHSYFFLGDSLMVPYSLHRVYISVHALFALCALTLAGQAWAPPRWRVLWQAGLIAYLVLLSSRNVLLTLAVLAVLYQANALLKGRFRQGLSALLLILVAGVASMAIPQVRDTLSKAKLIRSEWGTPATVNPSDGWQVRHFVWQAVDSLGSRAPWHGYGPGVSRVLLGEEYKKMNFTYGVEQVLNAHNQYLQIWLDLGWPGAALLLALVLSGLVLGTLRSRLLLALFLITALSFMTECYLEAQKGIVFFSLMWAVVGTLPARKEQQPEPDPLRQ